MAASERTFVHQTVVFACRITLKSPSTPLSWNHLPSPQMLTPGSWRCFSSSRPCYELPLPRQTDIQGERCFSKYSYCVFVEPSFSIILVPHCYIVLSNAFSFHFPTKIYLHTCSYNIGYGLKIKNLILFLSSPSLRIW